MKLLQRHDLQTIGEPVGIPADWTASGVSTNSRDLQSGDLFFAIRGERFDGHDFVQDAFRNGASACVVCRSWYEHHPSNGSARYVIVDDSVKALQSLAARYRRSLDVSVVAVTGTNGKTTCKEMLHAVLSTTFSTRATQGNLNNEIGLPLTLLGLDPSTTIAVIEMGATAKNDIRLLCDIAAPDSGIVTNAGKAHLQTFHDFDTVLSTKSELYDYLIDDGVRFVNTDLPYFSGQRETTKGLVTFGTNPGSDYRYRITGVDELARATFELITPAGEKMIIPLPVSGSHMVSHAAASAVIASELSVPSEKIIEALSGFRSLSNRFSVRRAKGVTLIDDTYNANPDSMIAAIETLKQMKTDGKKIAVLGDMLEMGIDSGPEHQRIGEHIARSGIDALLTFGPEAAAIHQSAGQPAFKKHFDDKKDLIDRLLEMITPGDTVLVKGSRGMKMEEVTEAFNQ